MNSNATKKSFLAQRYWWFGAVFVIPLVLGGVGWIWRAELRHLITRAMTDSRAVRHAPGHDDEDGHGGLSPEHPHAAEEEHAEGSEAEAHPAEADDHAHSEEESLRLGRQTQKTIGVLLTKVELRSFERTIAVPGIIVERPGWGSVEVTGAMTGIVTRVYPIQGQAVQPGDPLFDVRLTHEDLLQAQRDFLQTVEELDVIRREVARLEQLAQGGAIAGKTLLEREYEQQKQEAALRAQRQALLLHGLSGEQVRTIEDSRTLLPSLTISAPAANGDGNSTASAGSFQVQDLEVTRGSQITAGARMCRLADHSILYIEGNAFEQDMGAISHTAAKRLNVAVSSASDTDNKSEPVRDLRILYLDDKVNPDTRTFRFYVELPNRIVREDTGSNGRKFVYWQYKPGQRMNIRLPVETWPNRIVLPTEAVAQDGMDYYVFEANDGHFDRRAVHVEYRDADWVVIANDGSVKPGVTVAASAASQMQLAMKNKAGGAVDPHAGHDH